jgi:pimeloyl-ACP methyl ester carboxylesterase
MTVTTLQSVALEHRMVETNGIHLHVVEAGPPDGELVILLHGFPEFWYGWRHQIPALAEAGYRVLAPDQRGYNLSDKPREISAYRLDECARDVIGLIDGAGREKACVVGHDWGAVVAWWLAIHHPDRLRKLAILNVPHPSAMLKTVLTNPAQMLRSWYVGIFQIPLLPEFLMTFADAVGGISALLRTSSPGSFTDVDIPHYIRAWKQPGAATGMINWYRALVQRRPQPVPDSRVHVPTLIIWGRHDVALLPQMAQQSLQYCDNGRLFMLENATHWVQHDAPERVNQHLLEFL